MAIVTPFLYLIHTVKKYQVFQIKYIEAMSGLTWVGDASVVAANEGLQRLGDVIKLEQSTRAAVS